MFIVWIVLAIIVLLILAKNIVIVPQARAFIIERLGTYQGTWNTGLPSYTSRSPIPSCILTALKTRWPRSKT